MLESKDYFLSLMKFIFYSDKSLVKLEKLLYLYQIPLFVEQ